MICLLPNCGYISETSRMLEIGKALAERGAAVRIAVHGGAHTRLLDAAGVGYDQVGPVMDDRRGAAFVQSGIGLGPPGQSMYSDDELRAYALAEAAYFREHGVTAAVSGFTLTTLLSTRLAGIPLITEHAGSWVPPVFERGLLPAPTSVHGMPGFVPGPIARRLVARRLPSLRLYCGGFDRIAAELGVEPVPSMPALLLGDLTLVPEIPEVVGIPAAEMAAWRPGRGYRPGTALRYTGPLFAHLDVPVPEPVARFLDGPGPLVYVALTSTPPALVRDVVRAVRDTGARVLVAATVHDLDDLAGDRVAVGPVLPSHEIMPHADLAVVTAGQGSLQTAMACGVPAVGIPLQLEQDLNVVLLERLGAARRVAPSAIGSRLGPLVRRMLADDRYREAARRIQRLYDTADGPGAAADAILSFLVTTEVSR
ncbi:UDP:flavonoid glycosyltransferase YjiC (YdhE family) [Actinocorallia herbida]|uniref:UDP:flavonoid glycosyltransferase YjiC (YdhE family) n=1 Tax=Actinocorallia herbida TaxID=58109 RepID=A0A3N1D2R9_9ACTN|nr:glycosyltransferase [Actinocorallia herbida]ROO87368.1 UDP:flavonoid glycosyltransferase YjiC (YdhE family) [Actinocorallia herbida]